MPRVSLKTNTDKALKNILLVGLGMVMRRWRDAAGKSSDDIAEELKVGASFYRLFEAGSANIAIGRINTLYIVMSRLNNSIQFDALCKLMIAINVLEAGTSSVESMQEIVEELGETDEKIKEIFERIDGIWKFLKSEEDKKLVTFLEEKNFDSVIEEFLNSYKTFSISKDKKFDIELNELILDTPSLNLYMVSDFLKLFKNHPPLHIYNYASRWEFENKTKFSNLYGVYEDYEAIINDENLSIFKYDYLWHNQFHELHFVFLNEGIQSDEIKNIFSTKLKAILKGEGSKYQKELREFDDIFEKKVKVKIGIKSEFNQILQHSFDEENPTLIFKSNFWLFKLIDGSEIGFVSKNTSNILLIGTNLTYRESKKKLENFETLWKKLN